MESCLGENRWDQGFIDDETEDVIRASLLDLLRVGTTIEEATEEVKRRSSGLGEFSKKYIGKVPKVYESLVAHLLTSADECSSQTQVLA